MQHPGNRGVNPSRDLSASQHKNPTDEVTFYERGCDDEGEWQCWLDETWITEAEPNQLITWPIILPHMTISQAYKYQNKYLLYFIYLHSILLLINSQVFTGLFDLWSRLQNHRKYDAY